MSEPSAADDGRQQMSDALLGAELAETIADFNKAARHLRKEKGMSLRAIARKCDLQLPKSTIDKNFGKGRPRSAAQVRLYVRACGVSIEEEDCWANEWERVEAGKAPSILPSGGIQRAQIYLREMMRMADIATRQILNAKEPVETLGRLAAKVYGTEPPSAAASVPHNLHEVKRDLQQLVKNIDSIKKSTQDLLNLI